MIGTGTRNPHHVHLSQPISQSICEWGMHASQKGWGQVGIRPSDWHPGPWVEGCSGWTGSRSLFIHYYFMLKSNRATMHHANRVWSPFWGLSRFCFLSLWQLWRRLKINDEDHYTTFSQPVSEPKWWDILAKLKRRTPSISLPPPSSPLPHCYYYYPLSLVVTGNDCDTYVKMGCIVYYWMGVKHLNLLLWFCRFENRCSTGSQPSAERTVLFHHQT